MVAEKRKARQQYRKFFGLDKPGQECVTWQRRSQEKPTLNRRPELLEEQSWRAVPLGRHGMLMSKSTRDDTYTKGKGKKQEDRKEK